MTAGSSLAGPGCPGLVAVLALAALLVACGGEPDVHHHRFRVFDGTVEVSLYGMPREQAQPLLERVAGHLRERHDQWHAGADGALTRFNRQLAAGGSAPVPPELESLLETALPLAERTDYRFDPGIGSLYQAWGLASDSLDDAGPPPKRALERWRARPHSVALLERDNDRLTTPVEGMRLDFRAITTGMALEEARRILAQEEPEAAVVNAGGDMVTINQPGGRTWHTALRDPDGRGVIGSAALHAGEAAVTASVHDRRFRHEGAWYHGVLTPATGVPAEGLAAVTVIHDDPALADAAATALMIAGPDGWRDLATALGLQRVLVMTPDRALRATAGMRERLELDDGSDVRLRDAE